MKKFKFQKNRDGAVLITVIAVSTILMVLIVSALTVAATSQRQTYQQYEKQQSYYIARAGLDSFVDNLVSTPAARAKFASLASSLTTSSTATSGVIAIPDAGKYQPHYQLSFTKHSADVVKISAVGTYNGVQQTAAVYVRVASSSSPNTFTEALKVDGGVDFGSNSVFAFGGASLNTIGTVNITNNSGFSGGFYAASNVVVKTQAIYDLTKQNVSIFGGDMHIDNMPKYINSSPKVDNTDGYINVGGKLSQENSRFCVGQTDDTSGSATSPVDVYCSDASLKQFYQTGNFYTYKAKNPGESGNGDFKLSGNAVINGDLYVEGNLEVDGRLVVTGNIFVKGNITSESGNGGQGIIVNGYTECHGNMQYNSSNCNFGGDVYVGGNLQDNNQNTKQDVFGSTTYVFGSNNVPSLTTPPAVAPAPKTFPNDVTYADGDNSRGNRPELLPPSKVFDYEASPTQMFTDSSNEKYIGDKIVTGVPPTTSITGSCDLQGLTLNQVDRVDIEVSTDDIYIRVPSDYDFKSSLFLINNPTTDKFVYFVVDDVGDGSKTVNMNGLKVLSTDTYNGLGGNFNTSNGKVTFSKELYYGEGTAPAGSYKPGEIKTFFIANDGNKISMDANNNGPCLVEMCMFAPTSKLIANGGYGLKVNNGITTETYPTQVIGAAIFGQIEGKDQPTFLFYPPANGSMFDTTPPGGSSTVVTVIQYDKK